MMKGKLILLALMVMTILSSVALANYTAEYNVSEIPDIGTDVIGEGLVQTKTYMPLLILIVVVNIAVSAFVAWRVATR